MDADLDTLATALYVRTDDLLKASPDRAPWRPTVGIAPKISDAELITLAVMQALLGHTSEARWLRYTRSHLQHLFRYLPKPWSQADLRNHLTAAIQCCHQAAAAAAHEEAMSAQDLERRRLEAMEPGITAVEWGPAGEVLMPPLKP